MKNTKKSKLVWFVAALFTLSVASLITLDGVERSDWLYMAALPTVMAVLWMQYRNLFANSKEA
ncbi:hypothetical protein ACN259_003435 [Vibrio cholerae]|uniref:hypothetical protein n=1 Tax=Vibrio cholerae TaxID=666 RepID=UPI0011DA2466|nr:hypothetical protein [Vibrio cholerae]TXY78172.1 hypothetical protein FXE85_01980 [Vibrio cholerae]GHX15328.1 putative membrane protein [Vibrio cholerae]HAS5579297.1 hypothetical protein [Vibrio cholerae]HDL9469011.1 hypothetical protein [Vibrio cholerae]